MEVLFAVLRRSGYSQIRNRIPLVLDASVDSVSDGIRGECENGTARVRGRSTDIARHCCMATAVKHQPVYEEAKTPVGIVSYRQGWWCRMR